MLKAKHLDRALSHEAMLERAADPHALPAPSPSVGADGLPEVEKEFIVTTRVSFSFSTDQQEDTPA